MFSQIMTIFSVLKEFFNLFKVFMDMIATKKIADAEKRRQAFEKAISDLSNAKTPEGILDAQKRIVENSPH